MGNHVVYISKEIAEKERDKLSEKTYKIKAKGVVVIDPKKLDICENLTCGENNK